MTNALRSIVGQRPAQYGHRDRQGYATLAAGQTLGPLSRIRAVSAFVQVQSHQQGPMV